MLTTESFTNGAVFKSSDESLRIKTKPPEKVVRIKRKELIQC